MSDDLVKRLRSRVKNYEDGWREGDMLADEAAARIEKLEAALREIEYLDRPQVRGLPRRIKIGEIACKALEGEKNER